MIAATITIVDAPQVSLAEGEKVDELLLHFFRGLGWNGEDIVDPCKIRTTQEVYNGLYNQMCAHCPDSIAVGMFLMNRGPGTENDIPPGKVYLLEGWTSPAGPEEGSGSHDAQ